jgi:hypothetical protein
MSKENNRKKLVGPWRSIHGAIWLIGLAILAWQDWWWPGILVLVALSMLLEALFRRYAPQAYEEEEQSLPEQKPAVEQQPAPESQPSPQPTSTTAAPPAPEHRLELLPSECPKCSGPIRGHEVKWTGPQSADCPYCGANLPMK